MQDLIISISGLRGIVGENFNASVALRYACAFATFLKNSKGKAKLKIAVGTDSRPSGDMIKSAVMAGLCSVGAEVMDVGLVTTPTVGVMVRELACDGGLIITASHNPVEYNGIKLLTSKGIAPPPSMSEKVRELYESAEFTTVSSVDCGRITIDHSGDANHINKILDCVKRNQIAPRRFRIVLDSVNGTGARPTKRLLSIYGCRITALNDKPTGLFAHNPEPRKEHLANICDAVKKLNADMGFAQDPDADRLAVIDENGNYIGEEYTLALAAKNILAHHKGTVVTNLSTSRMIDDIAKQAGCDVIRTPVGEANVAQTMIKNNSPIGGEGNGGIIDLRVGPVRDSLIGIALILQLCAETNKKISELVAEIPAYEMVKDKFTADKKQAEKIFTQAKKSFKKAEINEADGCRFDFEQGWMHLRTSNTEPVIRLISEFKKDFDASTYTDKIKGIIEKITG